MPDQNQTNPPQKQSTQNPDIQSDPKTAQTPVSIISPQADLPPLPPAFQNVSPQTAPKNDQKQGTAAPANLPPTIPSTPRKKFGGGRIIATILGIFLLIGGVGAGLVLTQQQQLFQPKATYCSPPCGAGEYCNTTYGECLPVPTNPPGGGGGGGGGGKCTPKGCNVGSDCGSMADNCGGSVNCGVCPLGKSCIANVCTANNATCTPGQTALSCTVSGCPGTQTCDSTGNWGACVKSDPNCGGGSAGACGTYPNGSTRVCSQAGVQGTETCANGVWGSCTPTYGGNNAACNTTGYNCAGGYVCKNSGGSACQSGDLTCNCQPNTGTSQCGRDKDTGAPVCCFSTVSNSSTACPPGETKVCEGTRLECSNTTGPGTGTWCTLETNSSSCGGGTSTGGGTTPPSTPGAGAVCTPISAYSSTWTALSQSQLDALTPGSSINVCVNGSGTGAFGTFDMARFTVNGTALPDTTTHRPSSSDYCSSYTIPSDGTTSFNVTAQIHSTTLGWIDHQ